MKSLKNNQTYYGWPFKLLLPTINLCNRKACVQIDIKFIKENLENVLIKSIEIKKNNNILIQELHLNYDSNNKNTVLFEKEMTFSLVNSELVVKVYVEDKEYLITYLINKQKKCSLLRTECCNINENIDVSIQQINNEINGDYSKHSNILYNDYLDNYLKQLSNSHNDVFNSVRKNELLCEKYPFLEDYYSTLNLYSFEEIDISYKGVLLWECPKCKAILNYTIDQMIEMKRKNGRTLKLCPNCKEQNGTSFPEQAILFYLQKLTEAYKKSKPLEIDIYMPELKSGIEYCGAYFHNETEDQKKVEYYAEEGIRIIRVYDDGNENSHVDDVIRFIYDRKYSNLDYVINTICGLLALPCIEVNLDKDMVAIKERYLKWEYENSFATHPSSKRFSKKLNGNLRPENFRRNSNVEVYMECEKCHYGGEEMLQYGIDKKWKARIDHLTYDENAGKCPCCETGRVLVPHINSFFAKNPYMSKYYAYNHPDNNGQTPWDFFANDKKIKRVWICEFCGETYYRNANNVMSQGERSCCNKEGCKNKSANYKKRSEKNYPNGFITHPSSAYFHPELNGENRPINYPLSCNEPIYLMCKKSICQHGKDGKWISTAQRITRNKTKSVQCPVCELEKPRILSPLINSFFAKYVKYDYLYASTHPDNIEKSTKEFFPHNTDKKWWICKYCQKNYVYVSPDQVIQQKGRVCCTNKECKNMRRLDKGF